MCLWLISRCSADQPLVDQNLGHLSELGQPLLVLVEPARGHLLVALLLQQVPAKCPSVKMGKDYHSKLCSNQPVKQERELLAVRDDGGLCLQVGHPLAVEEAHDREEDHDCAVERQVVHVVHQHLGDEVNQTVRILDPQGKYIEGHLVAILVV